MKVKVAIISPQSLLQNILSAGEAFPSLTMIPYTYQHIEETVHIVHACKDEFDVLFFAGPIPYKMANEHIDQKPMIYLPHDGPSLYRALFQVLKDGGYDEEKGLRLSVDILTEHEALERIEELEINLNKLYVHTYQRHESIEDIADYHYRLWQNQQIDAVLTCYHSVYEKLTELQVACHRIIPSKRTITESFHWIMLEGRSNYLKDSQLAIGMLHVNSLSERKSLTSTEFRKKRMIFQSLLMDYAEEIGALMEWTKSDEIMFITTRGTIEKSTKDFTDFPLKNPMFFDLQIRISIGIGLGNTASDAEMKAREALTKAKIHKDHCCFVMMQDGDVYGPLGQNENLVYSSRTENAELLSIAKKATLSIGTINKLLSFCEKYNKNSLTAAELANGFGITVRSARRILHKLEENGLAKVIGEEQPITKGRPRQIYNITFINADKRSIKGR